MKNKVLIELVVPEIDEKFNLYLPVGRKIGDVISLLVKAVNELSYNVYTGTDKTALYNSITAKKYNPDELIYNTDIRNGTCLILL